MAPVAAKYLNIKKPPINGPVVVPTELNAWAKFRRLAEDGYIGIGGDLQHGEPQSNDEQPGKENPIREQVFFDFVRISVHQQSPVKARQRFASGILGKQLFGRRLQWNGGKALRVVNRRTIDNPVQVPRQIRFQ